MADANEIQLKITIDGKDAVAILKLTKEEVSKLKTAMDTAGVENNFNKSTKAVSQFGSVSKRELGMFANQLLYSSGITGRLGSQLSNLASGLLTGGAIGAAFAGFAALISTLTANIQEATQALNAAASSLIKFKSQMPELAEFNLQSAKGMFEFNKQIINQLRLQEELLLQQSLPGARLESLLGIARVLNETDQKRLDNAIAQNNVLEKMISQEEYRLRLADDLLTKQRNIMSLIGFVQPPGTFLIPVLSKVESILKETKEIVKAITGGRAGGLEVGLSIGADKASGGSFGRTGREGFGPANPITGAQGAAQINSTTITVLALNEALAATSAELGNIGAEGARAWLMNVMGIDRVRSVLQMLIIKFGEVFIQMLLIKGAGAFLNFLLPGSGLAFGAMAEGGSGIVTKPTLFLAGEGGPEAYNFSPLDNFNPSSMPQQIIVHVQGEFTQKGMDMRAVLNQVERNIRSRRSGE